MGIINLIMSIISWTQFALSPVSYFNSVAKLSCQPIAIGILMILEGSFSSLFLIISIGWWLFSMLHFSEIFKEIKYQSNIRYKNEILNNERIRIFWRISTPILNLSMWIIHLMIGITSSVFAFQGACRHEKFSTNALVFTIPLLVFSVSFPLYILLSFVLKIWFGTVVPKFVTKEQLTWENLHKDDEDEADAPALL